MLPQHVETYKKLIEGYYKGIHESPEFHARLFGSFEVVVGELDTFVHIWEVRCGIVRDRCRRFES